MKDKILPWSEVTPLSRRYLKSLNKLKLDEGEREKSEQEIMPLANHVYIIEETKSNIHAIFCIKLYSPDGKEASNDTATFIIDNCPTKEDWITAEPQTQRQIGAVGRYLEINYNVVCIAVKLAMRRTDRLYGQPFRVFSASRYALEFRGSRWRIDQFNVNQFPWWPRPKKRIEPTEKQQEIIDALEEWLYRPENAGMEDFMDRVADKAWNILHMPNYYYILIGGFATGKSSLISMIMDLIGHSEYIDDDENKGQFDSEVLEIPLVTARDDTAEAFTRKQSDKRKAQTTKGRRKKHMKYRNPFEEQDIRLHLIGMNTGKKNNATVKERRLRGGILDSVKGFEDWAKFCTKNEYWSDDGDITYSVEVIEAFRVYLHNRYWEADGRFEFHDTDRQSWVDVCSARFIMTFKAMMVHGVAKHVAVKEQFEQLRTRMLQLKPEECQQAVTKYFIHTRDGQIRMGYYGFIKLIKELLPNIPKVVTHHQMEPYMKRFFERFKLVKDESYKNPTNWPMEIRTTSSANVMQCIESVLEWYDVKHPPDEEEDE